MEFGDDDDTLSVGKKRARDSDASDSDDYDLGLFADAEIQAAKRRKMEDESAAVKKAGKRKKPAPLPIQQQQSCIEYDAEEVDDYDDELEEDQEPGTLFSDFDDDDDNDTPGDMDSMFGSSSSSSSDEGSRNRKKKRKKKKKKKGRSHTTSDEEEPAAESTRNTSAYPNMNVKWVPCMAPDADAAYKSMGRPLSKKECFGCKSGTMNMASQNYESWNKLLGMWKSSIVFADLIELARQSEAIFEECIRRPSNEHRPLGSEPVPMWPAATIYAHFTDHILEPTFQHLLLLRRVRDMTHNFITWQMYEENTGEPDAKRVRVPKEKGDVNRIPILKQLVDLEMKLYNAKPEKCFLAQREFKMVAEKATLINGERAVYARGVETIMYKGTGRS